MQQEINKPIRAFEKFHTNIKGLPEGEYITETSYSDNTAWKVMSKTKCTMTISKVDVLPDPEWKDKIEMHVGGFAGHCSNQQAQTWLFDRVREEHTMVVRLKKSPYGGSDKMYGSKHGRQYVINGAQHFYDYNF